VATDALPMEPAVAQRYQRLAVIAGAIGLVLCAVGWLVSPGDFFRSYLWAYCFFLGITLGSLVLVMLQCLTGGIWGLMIRRICEAATRTLPVLVLLFLPLAAGFSIPDRTAGTSEHSAPAISRLYVWATPGFFDHEHEGAKHFNFKAWYLSPPRFLTSAAIYFAVWLGVAYFFNRWSVAHDRPGAGDPRHLRMLSAAGMMLYGVTITLAAIDWIMSLEPRWVSSIFGVLIGVGQVLTALAFAVVVLALTADRPPLAGLAGRPVFRDLGSLMLAFVMVWAYISFSQFLLMWSGNLPSEIPYYLRRSQNGWQWVAGALALFQFALPFMLLLMRDVKRNRHILMRVAALVLVMRAVDLYWLIMPAQPGVDVSPLMPSWTDIVAPIGIGGIWLASFLGQLQQRALLPTYDPRLAEIRHHE
jgi:hypothetical protein